MPIQEEPVERKPEQVEAERKFQKMGHGPEHPNCDHTEWSFEKHGRYCPCGTIMADFGD